MEHCLAITLCLNLAQAERESLNYKWTVGTYIHQTSPASKCQKQLKLAEACIGLCDLDVPGWGRFQGLH